MTASLRINYVCPLPSLAGGIKSSRLISEALVRRGHDVRILFPTMGDPLPAWWRPRSRARAQARQSRELHRMSGCHHHLGSSTAKLIAVEGRVVRASDAPDADITIASWWACVEWIMSWPRSKGEKVHYIRGHDVFHQHRERAEAVYRSEIIKITISRWLRELVKHEYGGEAVLVPNGVDWSQFGGVPRAKGRVPVVGFLYGAGVVKDSATAFRACRHLQKSIPDLHVVAFGATKVEECEEVPNNFTYWVNPPQTQIASIYSEADCWVISSRSEGLSMPGLEAAACWCPVVATDCGGVRDFVVEGTNGHLVPVGDWQAMADRIRDVLSLSESEWAKKSRASHEIARAFNWDTSAELLENLFLSMKDHSPPASAQLVGEARIRMTEMRRT